MSKNNKSPNQTNPAETPTPAPPAKPGDGKKKLTLDITDVSEVLERKISP